MNFYGTFQLPNIKSISDSINLWSQNFSSREQKAVLNLLSSLLSKRDFDFNSLKDKKQAAIHVSDYIRRVYVYVSQITKDIGTDKDLCSRMKYSLDFDKYDNDIFKDFIEDFKNSDNSNNCKVNIFLNKNQDLTESIIIKKNLKIKGSREKGFSKSASELEKNIQQKSISCTQCSKIGDIIIGLISPENMQLEHTDHSFDFICNVLNKKHRRLNSETNIIKS